MKNYYVEGNGWFVTTADSKRKAYSEGVSEFGRGCVRCVREATQDETDRYVSQRGKGALTG